MAQNETPLIDGARELIAGRFHGVLATHSLEHPGYPFGSLLPYSLDEEGWPIVLVSHLAQHTRNFNGNPRCSLTLMEDGEGDKQRLMRLTMLADADPIPTINPVLAERYFRYFPESRDRFERLNFRFFRLAPRHFHCVGGFGSARWIGTERLRDRFRFSLDEESQLLDLVNGEFKHHLHRVYRTAFLQEQTTENPVLAVGIDRRGIDLRHDVHLCRRRFPEPVENTEILPDLLARL